ncbi:hypothetical protein IQ265_01030 [Nodosilinea sp. LEGE 06152]|uniref:hypothetical protein n=1 Tax=Nodosilinea sp. LEGE 06152 TaxID=2777966 RepID=UPI00187F1D84|nr:hypothetical protein [Nodosilinea sp. LEGE 06152]MBE9155430.1 hypothetical protein [Nodosilinea sp. LEGE 06152]
MTHGTLRLLQGFLGLLKLADLVTSLPGLALTLWLWLYLTLPYDTALTLWLIALVPFVAYTSTETQN